jgi:ABC-type protease/lipase transport system fused ATPase/permease subunit
MRWPFVPPLRHFVLLAAGASLLVNLAMLVPSLYTLQVFDRVFASRSIETLLMLSALTLGFSYCMDVAFFSASSIRRPPVLSPSSRASASRPFS